MQDTELESRIFCSDPSQQENSQTQLISKTQDQMLTQNDIQTNPTTKTYNMCFISQVVMIAVIGGFLFGYDTGVISGAQLFFKDDFPDITDKDRELIVSLTMVGAAIGSLFSGTLSDTLGRKPIILLADLYFTAGAAMMAFSGSVAWLMVGRLLIGFGVGFAAQIVPLYISEITPSEIRGKLVAMNVVTITIGQTLSVVLVFLIKPHWRVMLGLAGVPSLLQFFFMLFMPESPRWLSRMGKVQQMTQVMEKIYAKDHVQSEIDRLHQEMNELRVETTLKQRLKELFTTYKKCLLIGCSIQAFQQLCGINTAMYYGPDILKSAQIKFENYSHDDSALLLNIPLACTNAVGCLVSVYTIDRLGRRYILLRTLPFVSIAWLIVATGMALNASGHSQTIGGQVSFVGLMMFLLFYAIGIGTTPWAINSEIYPVHDIGTANSIATTVNWLANFLVSFMFLETTGTQVGAICTYTALAVFAACAWTFTYVLIPETAKKDIDLILKQILGK